jgi:hypothetical protein
VDDVMTAGITAGGFAGRKPPDWTHWVLRMLAYDPEVDDVVDLFPGTGSVAAAVATYPGHNGQPGRRGAPAAEAQRLRRTARAADDRKAAVLAALRAGGSIRAVAASAKVSTNTVQRWKRAATQQPPSPYREPGEAPR